MQLLSGKLVSKHHPLCCVAAVIEGPLVPPPTFVPGNQKSRFLKIIPLMVLLLCLKTVLILHTLALLYHGSNARWRVCGIRWLFKHSSNAIRRIRLGNQLIQKGSACCSVIVYAALHLMLMQY
jgi:hypothetical protein